MMQSNSDWLSQSLKKSCICVWHIYHAELSNTALSSDQFMSGSFICMHNVTHSSMTELLNTVLSSQTQFFHQINSWVVLSSAWVLQYIHKPNCQTLSVHQINPWVNHSFTCKCDTFINAELSNTAHSSNQFWVNLLFTCIMRHVCQSWIQLFYQTSFNAWWRYRPHCNTLQSQLFYWINSQKLLHLYMMHSAVSSFLNKALSLNQLQDIMKVLSRSEQQHNHNCSW